MFTTAWVNSGLRHKAIKNQLLTHCVYSYASYNKLKMQIVRRCSQEMRRIEAGICFLAVAVEEVNK